MISLAQAGLSVRPPAATLTGLLALSPALLRTLSTYSGDDAETKNLSHDKRYVDRLKITARAGRGGSGCVSFYQGASRGRHAVGDGGSGGRGGDVVVRATAKMKSLAGVQQLYKADAGTHGTKQRQHGRSGKDAVVLVPLGTVVQRVAGGDAAGGVAGEHSERRHWQQQPPPSLSVAEVEQQDELDMPDWLRRWRRPYTGADYISSSSDSESEESKPGLEETAAAASAASTAAAGKELPEWAADVAGSGSASRAAAASNSSSRSSSMGQGQVYEVVADLTEEGQEVVVARGGSGGRGNAGVKHRRLSHVEPGEMQRGEPGETTRLLLELKLLADVGLVGLPNAGKSTLLRTISAAMPRVGDYAFTTLGPQLGVVRPPSRHSAEDPLVVADIPGLIQGAHEDRGLGHRFLRHIERTKALAYVLDCQLGTAGRPGPKCWEQLEMLQTELRAYSPRLADLPALVVANKVEMLVHPARTLGSLERRTRFPVLALSALHREVLLRSGSVRGPVVPPRCTYGGGGITQGRLAWISGMEPLVYWLARLLYEAGAREHPPDWAAVDVHVQRLRGPQLLRHA